MDFLKQPLGDELFSQVQEKLKTTKIKLADLSAGGYVGKEKFDAMEADRDGYKTRLTEANDKIKEFEGLDIDAVKKEAADWKEKAEQAEKDAAARVAAVEYDTAVKDYVSGIPFSSEAAKRAFVADLKAKELKLENGKLLGADDFKAEMQKADPSAFAKGKEGVRGIQPLGAEEGGGGSGGDVALAAQMKDIFGLK